MPNETPNYHLKKPTVEEFYDVAIPNENMDKIDLALKELNEKSGDLENLNTQEKSDLVVAVNELKDQIGNLTNLKTDEKESLVKAVNEIHQIVSEHLAHYTNRMNKTPELGDFYGCTLSRITAQSIPSGIFTTVSFNFAHTDTNGMFDISEPSKITIKNKGMHFVNFRVALASGVDPYYASLRLNLNNVAKATSTRIIYSGEFSYSIETNAVIFAQQNDYITILLQQISGSAKDIQTTVDRQMLEVVRIPTN